MTRTELIFAITLSFLVGGLLGAVVARHEIRERGVVFTIGGIPPAWGGTPTFYVKSGKTCILQDEYANTMAEWPAREDGKCYAADASTGAPPRGDHKPDSEMWGLVWCSHHDFKGTFAWDGHVDNCREWDSDANRKVIPIWEGLEKVR